MLPDGLPGGGPAAPEPIVRVLYWDPSVDRPLVQLGDT